MLDKVLKDALEEEHVALAALGVDSGQGYLLGRPATDPQRWKGWGSQSWLGAPAATALTVPAPRG